MGQVPHPLRLRSLQQAFLWFQVLLPREEVVSALVTQAVVLLRVWLEPHDRAACTPLLMRAVVVALLRLNVSGENRVEMEEVHLFVAS